VRRFFPLFDRVIATAFFPRLPPFPEDMPANFFFLMTLFSRLLLDIKPFIFCGLAYFPPWRAGSSLASWIGGGVVLRAPACCYFFFGPLRRKSLGFELLGLGLRWPPHSPFLDSLPKFASSNVRDVCGSRLPSVVTRDRNIVFSLFPLLGLITGSNGTFHLRVNGSPKHYRSRASPPRPALCFRLPLLFA